MQALIFFFRLIPPALLQHLVRWHFDSVRQVSPLALALDVTGASVLLFDVRTHVEYECGHIAGAIHVTDDKTAKRLIDAFRADIPAAQVVAYCSVGYRSAQFALRMAAIGVDDVENLEGGIWAWDRAGQPIVRALTVKAT